nr:hypothetical protein StreXyl84_63990 [Streptomyces sp. Xyl84]
MGSHPRTTKSPSFDIENESSGMLASPLAADFNEGLRQSRESEPFLAGQSVVTRELRLGGEQDRAEQVAGAFR